MKREDVFERLEPPCGGLAQLREGLTSRPSSMVRRFVPVAAALAIAAGLLPFFFWSRVTTTDLVAAARLRAGLEQIALGLAPASGESAVLTDQERATTALTEVPTANPAVAFCWVDSTTWTN